MKCMWWGGKIKGTCDLEAKWKVPMWGEPNPHCLCDEHVKPWNESQPHNVKAIDDDTPWVNVEMEYYKDSRVRRS